MGFTSALSCSSLPFALMAGRSNASARPSRRFGWLDQVVAPHEPHVGGRLVTLGGPKRAGVTVLSSCPQTASSLPVLYPILAGAPTLAVAQPLHPGYPPGLGATPTPAHGRPTSTIACGARRAGTVVAARSPSFRAAIFPASGISITCTSGPAREADRVAPRFVASFEPGVGSR
jgi:hypothetical protein